jgi:hypothetical protein
MKATLTILLLIISNSFMTLAWYGHLKFYEMKGWEKLSLFSVILISWGIAFLSIASRYRQTGLDSSLRADPSRSSSLKLFRK